MITTKAGPKYGRHLFSETSLQKATKSAELVAKNKMTVVELTNLLTGEELEKVLPDGYTRIQDFLNDLNELPEYELICNGWYYHYYVPQLAY